MARVIKAGGAGQKPARPATRVIVDAGAKKVIEREVYQAKQDAEHILKRAEEARQQLLADGKRRAAQAREEAMARGASEAFATAAAEALTAFRRRAERYGEAADDIRALALEVVKKVLGNEPDLGPNDVDKILQKGMTQLRARRRLRVQVSARRLGELAVERPNLMKALQSEPDLLVESVDDVGLGFARVVTEVGGALCAEETALDALSRAVNVREQPRHRDAVTGNTHVGDGPSGLSELRAESDSVPDAAVIEEEPDELGERDEFAAPEPSDDDADDDLHASLGDDDDSEATLHLDVRRGERRMSARRRDAQGDADVEEIVAEEDDVPEEQTRRLGATQPRVRTGKVQVGPAAPPARGARAPTRVLAIDVPSAEDDDSTLRGAGPLLPARADDLASEEDPDLDLFTDDAATPGRRRR